MRGDHVNAETETVYFGRAGQTVHQSQAAGWKLARVIGVADSNLWFFSQSNGDQVCERTGSEMASPAEREMSEMMMIHNREKHTDHHRDVKI